MEHLSEGFFVLAVLVITFINWLSDRLKRRRAQKKGEDFDVDPNKYIFFEEEATDQQTPEPEKTRAFRQDPNDEIRHFFEAISGQAPLVEAPQPEEPPPLPAQAQRQGAARRLAIEHAESFTPPAVEKHELSAEEKAALEQYNRMISSGRFRRKKEQRSVRIDGLKATLRNQTTVRRAILINDILGTPKGLEAKSGMRG